MGGGGQGREAGAGSLVRTVLRPDQSAVIPSLLSEGFWSFCKSMTNDRIKKTEILGFFNKIFRDMKGERKNFRQLSGCQSKK